MLVVEGDGTLDSGVRDGIAVSKILGCDTRAGLILLRDIVGIGAGGVVGGACAA